MLRGFTLPIGLLVEPVHYDSIRTVKPSGLSSKQIDQKTFSKIIANKLDWCLRNKTCKNVLLKNKIRNNKTRKCHSS